MTIKTSGTLSIAEINAEFGLGTNLYVYRGVQWFRDDNSRGFFDGATGNNPPIDIYEFYGKRKNIPVAVSDRGYSNGEYFTVPFYNRITIRVQAGSSGGNGSNGAYIGGQFNGAQTGGSAGNPGGASSVGSYSSGTGGGGNYVSGPYREYVINATDPGAPLRGVPWLVTVGGGGGGGAGGQNWTWRQTCVTSCKTVTCIPFVGCACTEYQTTCDNNYQYYNDTNAATGGTGSAGAVSIRVE